jgi:hypothetical protein
MILNIRFSIGNLYFLFIIIWTAFPSRTSMIILLSIEYFSLNFYFHTNFEVDVGVVDYTNRYLIYLMTIFFFFFRTDLKMKRKRGLLEISVENAMVKVKA